MPWLHGSVRCGSKPGQAPLPPPLGQGAANLLPAGPAQSVTIFCPQDAMSEGTDPLSALGRDCAAAVVSFLGTQSVSGLRCLSARIAPNGPLPVQLRVRFGVACPVQALSLSACSKAWRQLVLDDEPLWQTRAASDLPPPLLQAAAAAAASGHCSWHAAYQRATRLQSLRCVAWSSEGGQQGRSVAGRQPRPREGHAACAWGARSMLVCGGFGGGILSGGDLHLLTPAKSTSSGSRGSGSSSPGAGSSGGSSGGSLRWVQPKVANRPPVHRYGHTLTRCGPAGELAVLFGGLQAGGYQAPLDTLAVLRRKGAPASSSGAAAAGASHAAGPAAAASSASGGGGNDDANSGSGSEEETSLALRLGGWQGGADGGGLQQLLWAQMFDFFMGQDDEEDEEEEEEEDGESEDAELSDGDSQGAGSSDEEGEDGWESASGMLQISPAGLAMGCHRCCRGAVPGVDHPTVTCPCCCHTAAVWHTGRCMLCAAHCRRRCLQPLTCPKLSTALCPAPCRQRVRKRGGGGQRQGMAAQPQHQGGCRHCRPPSKRHGCHGAPQQQPGQPCCCWHRPGCGRGGHSCNCRRVAPGSGRRLACHLPSRCSSRAGSSV